MRFFIGHDPRESANLHILIDSILRYATVPAEIIPLHVPMLAGFNGQQDGTNAFIYSRFLVPYLCGFNGWALYMDSDMLFRDAPEKLWSLRHSSKAALVVKHEYKTKATRKMVGTPMESPNGDYPRKNWSSLILWNCGHPQNRILTREFVSEAGGQVLHRFSWLGDDLIGEIPRQWNHLVGEYPHDPEAKCVHFTLGAPGFSSYSSCDYAAEWHEGRRSVTHMEGQSDV